MKEHPSIILGIETSCDETAVAIVQNGQQILANEVASQIDLLEQYGGVYPELACRRHADVLCPLIQKALDAANLKLSDIEGVAVSHTPGLIGALLIGTMTAKSLAYALNIPFVGVHHIEAHLYAALMTEGEPVQYPAIGVVLSGGHTALLRVDDIGNYTLLGATIDDAIGEAFDKVARILELPYPGGPHVETLARSGQKDRFTFKAGRVKERPLAFSFSGLKTKVLYTHRDTPHASADIAAAFQHTAFSDVITKTLLAAKQENTKTLLFGGGVTANCRLREMFQEACKGEYQLYWPQFALSVDNAAMVAGLGYHVFRRKGGGDDYTLSCLPTNKHLSF